MPKFNIGDIAFRARAGQEQIWITCPECLGSGRLRIILGDNSEFSIECVCCARGYEGSSGKMQTYAFINKTEIFEVTGMESDIRDGVLKIRYRSGCWSVDEEDLFVTREEAQVRANQLMIEHRTEEAKRLKYKEKDTKTWAWNVSYHHRQIKEAQRRIEYHTSKLNVAPKNPRAADKENTK